MARETSAAWTMDDVGPLPPEALLAPCDESMLQFETTAELEKFDGTIEQKRALDAIELGLHIDKPNYNIYVSGAAGTGRLSTVRSVLAEVSRTQATPDDWCYVFNFPKPDRPLALRFPPGEGNRFRQAMTDLVDRLKRLLPEAYHSQQHQSSLSGVLGESLDEENELYARLTRKADELGFTIKSTKSGLMAVPTKEGKALSNKAYSALPEKERRAIEKQRKKLTPHLSEFLQYSRQLDKDSRGSVEELNHKMAQAVVGPEIDQVRAEYADHERVLAHLHELEQDIITHLHRFVPETDTDARLGDGAAPQPTPWFQYQVNVVVDNSELEGARVVVETQPTFYRLFGKIEKRVEYGIYTTDFTMIKAGSLLRANGGFLVLMADDIMSDPEVWTQLKRVIMYRELAIEDLGEHHSLLPTSGVRPEPIPIRVKVVLVGSSSLYHVLYRFDEGFRKYFQVRADFDHETGRTAESIMEYARFAATICDRENLPPIHRSGVAAIVERGCRLVGAKDRFTLRFSEITNLCLEAAYHARQAGAGAIERAHVEKAIAERENRSSLIAERVYRDIGNQTLDIDVDGDIVGQINGLGVYKVGEHQFGRPLKITAQTFSGKSGIVNIEREAKLGGNLQHKGVLIISGYLGWRFAQQKALSLSVSLCFEQSYSSIDGDSASVAELLAILSSLSDTPVFQGIAVTGSANQRGEIQVVGGINHKIEGFFRVCRELGRTDRQGVVVPRQNVRNLVLSPEVVEAVADKTFHIYQVDTVEQALKIVTGVSAGVPKKGKSYRRGSVFYRVMKRLEAFEKKPTTSPLTPALDDKKG